MLRRESNPDYLQCDIHDNSVSYWAAGFGHPVSLSVAVASR
jgi:hypothetical protein